MTTEPKQFERLLELIPPEVMPYVWFFPLPSGEKFPPEVPKGTKMKFNEKYRLTAHQALDRMKKGKNVGIYALPQGLLFIDADTNKGNLVLPEEILNNFPATLTMKSRNNGYHYYFINNGLIKNKVHNYNGVKSGEVKANWQYVVAPGSFVANDDDGRDGANGLYSIINDAPIITLDKIPEGITVSDKPIEEIEIEHKGTWKNDLGMPLYEIREKSQKLDTLLKGANEADRSAADMAACQLLYFWRFSDSEIAGILQEYRTSEKTARQDYLETTISKIERSARYDPNYKGSNGNGNSSEPVYEELSLDEIKKRHAQENSRQLRVNLPNDHFINVFVKHQNSLSDAYPDYHITDALWTLSAITQGKVILKLKQEHISPNLWIMNIGKSTKARKSTAVNKARNLFEVATDTDLYNDDYSIEGYLETLESSPILNNVRDEASGLFAKFHKKYNDGIFALECAVYDRQNIKKTLGSNGKSKPRTFTVKKPYVTKLYATTPDGFAKNVLIEDITGGYGVRFMYTYPKYAKDRKPLTRETPEDVTAWANIMYMIKTLYNKFKSLDEPLDFEISDEALEYNDNVSADLENYCDEQNNAILDAVVGRAQIHILKIAMLLEIGKSTPSCTITLDSIIEAANMVKNYFIPTAMELIEQLQEDVKLNKIEKIKGVLLRLGGTATHVKTLRDSKILSREFEECILTMVESKVLQVFTEAESKAKHYVLLNHNKKVDVREVRQVRSVREFAQPKEKCANIANNVTVDTKDEKKDMCVPDQINKLVRTCEPCEHSELCEESEIKKDDSINKYEDFFKTAGYERMKSPDTLTEMGWRTMAAIKQLKTNLNLPQEQAVRVWQDYCIRRSWPCEPVRA